MIEAMANGTPVVAFRHGAVPEVIDEGITGFVVDNVDETLSRGSPGARPESTQHYRRQFELRFSVDRVGPRLSAGLIQA